MGVWWVVLSKDKTHLLGEKIIYVFLGAAVGLEKVEEVLTEAQTALKDDLWEAQSKNAGATGA